MDELADARERLQTLAGEAGAAILESPFGASGCARGTAFYDSRKDSIFTGLASFQPGIDALIRIPAVQSLFGIDQGRRLAIQFVYATCRPIAEGLPFEAAFDEVWNAFALELQTRQWTSVAVANIQNLESSENGIELVDGVSVHARSFEELSTRLKWSPSELEYLERDWSEGGMSSFVMLVESSVPKTPANFLNVDDGMSYARAARVLLAMRLLAPGDVRIGRLFMARPSAFNVGLGGIQSTGFTFRHHGKAYELTSAQAPQVKKLYDAIVILESQPTRANSNLLLALRSFSSIYDRFLHQTEDRVVDAITSLEALWRLEAELSFRLAFRTSGLLAYSDEERVMIYETISQYYKIRSKLVHGGSLNPDHLQKLWNDEPLRALVRRTLRAFLHLAVNPGEWTLKRLYDEVDVTLLHSIHRHALQVAMDVV